MFELIQEGSGVRKIQRGTVTIIMSESLYELMLARYFAFLRATLDRELSHCGFMITIVQVEIVPLKLCGMEFPSYHKLVDSAVEIFNKIATDIKPTSIKSFLHRMYNSPLIHIKNIIVRHTLSKSKR